MTGRPGARWEFRCWPPADILAAVAARVDAAGEWHPLPDERRTDTYLLPPGRPDLMPKLRGGERFEIKRRLEVRDGLELWEMALSEDWPLGPEAGERAAERLAPFHLPPDLESGSVGTGDWRIVALDKARRRWRDERGTVEVTRVTAPQVDRFAVAFEGARPQDARTVIEALGLASQRNQSYRRWIENAG